MIKILRKNFEKNFLNVLQKLVSGQCIEKWFSIHNKILENDVNDDLNEVDVDDCEDIEISTEDLIENEELNAYLCSKKLFSSLKMIVVILTKLNLNEFKIEKIKLDKILDFLIEAKFKIIDYLLKYNSLNHKNVMQTLKHNDFVKHLSSVVSTSLILVKTDNL